jgi:hypothetical protein
MINLASGESAGKAEPIVVRADLGDHAPQVGTYAYPNQLQAAAATHPGLRRAPLALRLLALLADHAATTGRCWPSIHALADRLGSWRDSVRRALRLLARFQFVSYSRSAQGGGYVFNLPIDPTLRSGAGGARLASPGGRASTVQGGALARPELIRTDPEELTRPDAGPPMVQNPDPVPDPPGCPPAPAQDDPADCWVSHPLEVAAVAGPAHPATARAVGRAAEILATRLGAQAPAVVADRLWAGVRDREQARRLRRAAAHVRAGERYGWAPADLGRRFGAICRGHELPLPVHPDSEAAQARVQPSRNRAGGEGPAPLGGLLARFLGGASPA